MQKLHRILSNGDAKLKAFLDAEGIPYEYEESIVGKTVFLVLPESDPRWHRLAKQLLAHDVFHSVEVKFAGAEIAAAQWCRLLAAHFGYPQPADDFRYRRTTYGRREACSVCGTVDQQVAPFRVKNSPVPRGVRIFQLNWVFDEFFVTHDCRDQLTANQPAGVRRAGGRP
jgi:hypothetical protein